jgi:hypothetical protein
LLFLEINYFLLPSSFFFLLLLIRCPEPIEVSSTKNYSNEYCPVYPMLIPRRICIFLLFPLKNNSTMTQSAIASNAIADINVEGNVFFQSTSYALEISDSDAVIPPKLPTPFFSRQSMIVAVSRAPLPSPAYRSEFSQRYRELAARYTDSDGNNPDYLDHYYGGENHLILLHIPVTGLDYMMKANRDGTLCNATMNYLLYLLGPTFLDGLVLDVYPFRAPPDCKGKKWFKAQYGKVFVEACEALTLELLLAVSQTSSIARFVSMGKNGHRLLKSANLSDSHRVSNDSNHPHSAIQWGIDLDMALRLDHMASLVTGVEIRSSENHYNHHRDEYDAINACRYGGTNMTLLQKDKRMGGPGMTLVQKNKRIESAYGGPNMTQLQRDKRLRGPKMSQLQNEGRRIGGVIGGSKPSVRQIITFDMVAGECSGCDRTGLTNKGKNGHWSRHQLYQQGTKNKKNCGYYYRI